MKRKLILGTMVLLSITGRNFGRQSAPEAGQRVLVQPEPHAQAIAAKEQMAMSPASFQQPQAPISSLNAMLGTYCITCHNQSRKLGGVALDNVDASSLAANADVWEKVLRKLRGRLEPRGEMRRPDAATYNAAIASIEGVLDRADPPLLNPAERIDDLELATRLSTFLWGASPDGPLLDAAKRGQLKDPVKLAQQTRRMLADPKSQALAANFFARWIHLENLDTIHSSPANRPELNVAVRENMQRSFEAGKALFPQWDEELRSAFRQETELFLDSQVRDDRPAMEMWTANYTFVNERLGKFYGIPGASGSQFRRVTLSGDKRAGLLGQGSILTLTSLNDRISSTQRGKWLISTFFGTPPPPPSPGVPPLSDVPSSVKPMHERMEAHLHNPVCASCHAMFEPLAFALENFDAIGQWQDLDGGVPVDASGTFVDGSRFNGPAEFRAGLMKYRDAYVSGVTEKMMAFALGLGVPGTRLSRELHESEMSSVRSVVRAAKENDYRWSSIIVGIVQSAPFQRLN